MNLQTPIGPELPIGVARRFAIDQIDMQVSTDPAMIAAFWNEVSGSTPPAHPDLTVFYCFLRSEGAIFTLLEFVSGQTLRELCVHEDPAVCDNLIPLFSRLLDAHDGGILRNRCSPEAQISDGAIELFGCGVARAEAPLAVKLHGTMLIRPDGSWSEEILSRESGRSAAYPLLVAVYKELMGRLPQGTPLAPAALTSFSKRSLTKPEVTARSTRALPYVAGAAVCALLLAVWFGAGHYLAQRAGSGRIAGLNLPPMAAVVEAAPSIGAAPPPEPDVLPVTPGKETLVISKAGLSRGPRLIRQIAPVYPPLARKQNISGVVKLEITVAEDGSVWKAKVLSGDPLLARGAAAAVKKWIYQPALVNGKRSSSTTEVEIKFDLDAAL